MISDDFITAIENHNIRFVRILLSNSLLYENSSKDFPDMNTYAKSKIPELYDAHDGEEMLFDRSLWTDKYLAKLMAQVIINFSPERVNLIKNICAERYKYNESNTQEGSETMSSDNRGRFTNQQKIGIGLSGAGIAISIVGVIISKPIVMVFGGIALISGTLTYVKGSQEK